MLKILSLVLLASFTSLYSYNQCTTLIDLNQWIEAGSDDASGNWQVSANGMELTQTINSQPSMFISPEEFINVEITGSIRVDTTWDNDFIGFVFGLQQPLTITNTGNDLTMDGYLFDWKQEIQNQNGDIAQEGFALSKIDGTVNTSGTSHSFWTHTTSGAFTLLDSDFGTNKGWVNFQEYDFRLIYKADYVAIYVDEVLKFELDGCFVPGRFGFYNYSQAVVKYSNFLYTPINDFQVEGICVGDTTSFIFTKDSCTLASGEDYTDIVSWDWDFGNGNNSSESNPTTFYSSEGSYLVEVITQDSLGCRDTTQRTIDIFSSSEKAVISEHNVFTPNNDGFNDEFIMTIDPPLENEKLKIYNRWGNLVVEFEESPFLWDGSDFNSSVYYWILEYSDDCLLDNGEKSGTVTLLK